MTPALRLLLLMLAVGSRADVPVFRVPLDSDGRVTLSWTVDYSRRHVQMEVHLAAAVNTWFAVGFSDYGDPTPADYCVLWPDWKGRSRLQDTWADEEGRLSMDDEQDCDDFHLVRRHNVTKFTFTRRFDTCDDHDYVIEDGTTHIVWAEGRGPLFRLSGLNVLDGTSSGMQRAQLLKNVNPFAPNPPGTWSHDVMAESVKVPSDDTTYWCHVHRLPEQLRTKHHVVQFEAVVQEGNEALVHHMEVFHCVAPPEQNIPEYKGPCFAPQRPETTQVCKRVLAAWAMGAPPFVYPEEGKNETMYYIGKPNKTSLTLVRTDTRDSSCLVCECVDKGLREEAGLPIGGPDFNSYVMLEIHYNNPEKKSDWVDSTGVRLYISPTLRKYDGGVIELGLEYTDKMAIPPHQPQFTLTGYCISECTAVGIPPEGIVIFGSQLHTHLTGIRVFTRHIRDGRELPELNRDNHYSTHFQEIRLLKREVRVLPGDALITTCWYQTTERTNITMGGYAISDEMCVNYVHYYPKVDLEVCKSSISNNALDTYFRFLREWEDQQTSSSQGISSNYQAVDWTPMRSQMLEQMYQQFPISMQCNQSSGERFPGYWEDMISSHVLFPLPPQTRECSTEETV